jgi:hypothetical protein
MVNKPDYIQYLELQDGVFSIMKFHNFEKEIIEYLDEKSFDRVYEVGLVSKSGKARWSEVIYKTKQGFFFHLNSNNEEEETFSLTIYYKPENRNELLLLTTQILKPFKDGAIINTATEK